jgi:outer membrane protein TolC
MQRTPQSLRRSQRKKAGKLDVPQTRTNRRGRQAFTLLVTLFFCALPAAAQQPAAGRVLTLEDAIRIAIQNNRDLEDARLGYQGARGQVREAWSNVYPTLDLAASYTRNLSVSANFLPAIIFDPDASPDDLIPVKFGADNQWAFSLRAEQPLFRASAFLGVGAAARYQRLQGEVVRGRAISVATRVKMAYYDVLLADESTRLNDNTVRRVRQTLNETQKMNQAGLSSNYDVLRLQVELANIEPQLRRSRNASHAARRLLAVELGLENLDSVNVAGALSEIDLGEPVVTEASDAVDLVPVVHRGTELVLSDAPARITQQSALEIARANRSDLRQLDLTAQLRRTELRAEQSEYLPQVTLFGVYTINAQHNGDPAFFGGDNRFRSYGRQVGVEVSLPIFAGLRRPARVEQKRVVLEQVLAQRDLLVDAVENEVKTYLDQVEEARTRAQAQHLARSQAQRGFEIASAQYREGISSQLEVTDAEVALRQSEFNLAEAVYDYLAARARLDEAMGLDLNVDVSGKVAFQREDDKR